MDDLNLNFSSWSDDLDTFLLNLEPSPSTLGAIIPSPSSDVLNNGHFDSLISLNNQTTASILANEVNSVPINSDNLNLGLMDSFAVMDQIGNQTLPINEQFMPTLSNPMNPHELPPSSNYFLNLLMGHDEELPPSDNFPNQNQPNEPIIQSFSHTQNIQINNVEQVAPSNLDGLAFPLMMNALEQQQPMLPYFGSKAMSNVGQSYNQLPHVEYAPPVDSTTFSNRASFENSIRDIMNHDPVGVACFLAGVVRPSKDVSHIYKCGICLIQFPSPQAFGGHMKSHGKRKKDEEDEDEGGKGKKAKGGKNISSSGSSSSCSKKKAKTN